MTDCNHTSLIFPSCKRRKNVDYIIGLAKNKRVNALAEPFIELAEANYQTCRIKQRLFGEIEYGADTWKQQQRVIVKAEHSSKGANPRYVVTNIQGDPQELYDHLYCQRGEMENRIKEQQLYLFADRTSCHNWWPNQFRLLLSSLRYVLVESIRCHTWCGTELARACCHTIQLKLLKIGAVILRNTRQVRFLMSSSYPYQTLFRKVWQQLQFE